MNKKISHQQLHLIRPKELGSSEHGGDLRQGRRKIARPFSPDASMHVVMKSDRARGRMSLLHRCNRAQVERLIYVQASRAGVRVYQIANVGNHLHLLIKALSRWALRRFLRALAGLIARHVLKEGDGASSVSFAEGKKPPSHRSDALGLAALGEVEGVFGMPGVSVSGQAPSTRRFWNSIPFTRLIHWGREYNALKAYLGKNQLEAVGFAGAKLRFNSKGEAVIVIGDPNLRPDDDFEEVLRKELSADFG